MNTACGQDTTYLGDSPIAIDTIYSGMNIPWEIQIDPDGKLWTTERHGVVRHINPETKEGKVVLDISKSVYASGESGLLGLALHPDFNTSSEVYLVYTYFGSSVMERLVKYEFVNDSLVNPTTLIDSIPGSTNHDGSRLLFMDDGTLLMTTGDALNKASSQNINSLNGKVLRINTDGSVPSGNPYPGFVYSIGHRNAQGLCHHPNGNIYISEHGPNTDDEFQILVKGGNYGWPDVHGYCNLPAEMAFCDTVDVVEPVYAWTPTIAVSDIAYYPHSSIDAFENRILLTTLKQKRLFALELNEDGDSVISSSAYFINQFGRLRDVLVSPDHSIYLLTNGPDWANSEPNTHYIIRIRPLIRHTSVKDVNPRILVYPNPASSYIRVEANESIEHIVLSDLNGKEVYSSANTQIDVSSFETGMYQLEIRLSSGIVRRKITVVRLKRLPFFDINVRSKCRTCIDLTRTTNWLFVIHHLFPLRYPTR